MTNRIKHLHGIQQRGMAVISAMLLAALTAVIVSQMIWQQQLLISEIENQQDATQAAWLGQAAINWSRAILAEDARVSNVDHLREIWATKLPMTPIDGGTITGTISDQQQYFNLNNIAGKQGISEVDQKIAAALLERMGQKTDLVDAVTDWLDADEIKTGSSGAESTYYLSQTPAYKSANQAITEMGNLIRVRGFSPEIIRKSTFYMTALPERTSINVNTASAEVLNAAIPGSALADMQALVTTRSTAPFNNLDDFRLRLPDPKLNINAVNLSVNSRFFLVTCIVNIGHSNMRMEALLVRDSSGWPTILWKRFG